MPSPERQNKYVRQDLRAGKPGTIAEWQADDHGVDHAQYFQGCGVALTRWDDVSVGAGDNPREAYEDAVEQLAMAGWDTFLLPARPRGFSSKSEIEYDPPLEEDESGELYHYVCVYVRGIPPR